MFFFVTRSTITNISLKSGKVKFSKTTKTLYIHYNDKRDTENRENVLQQKYNLKRRLLVMIIFSFNYRNE